MISSAANLRLSLLSKGYLRAAINLANIALVQVDPATGLFEGVSPQLAREFAQSLGCRVEFVTYPSAAKILERVDQDEWDIAFLAADPAREEKLFFSPAYALVEGTLVVREATSYRSLADVDEEGLKICVTRNAAYDLYLARHLSRAAIVHASTPAESLDLFLQSDHAACAGIRQALERFVSEHEGFRVLTEAFLTIRQTIAVSRVNEAAGRLVQEFVETALRSGFRDEVIRAAERKGVILAS